MPIGLFQAFGVEIEWMIVDRESLAVRPIADLLLRDALALPGAQPDDEEEGANPDWPGTVVFDDITWSNELAAHVVEFKTSAPARSLAGLHRAFHAHAQRANELLRPLGAMLLPGGAHPFMDPAREFQVWKHGTSEVYQAFDRIFDCRGHGWANLQSMHLNLPFAGDGHEADQFGRLHAAVRVLLPILPAIAAGSPILDGRATGVLDRRMESYGTNSARVPAMAGRVVPEPAFTRRAYEAMVLEPIYAALAPLDPEGILRDEWANARGAIARFSRGSIEVRVIDAQECPSMDLAIARATAHVARMLCDERLGSLAEQQAMPTEPLVATLRACIREGDRAIVDDAGHLACLGWRSGPVRASELWRHLLEGTGFPLGPDEPMRVILEQGCLGRRIMGRMMGRLIGGAGEGLAVNGGATMDPAALRSLALDLSSCLASDRPLQG